LKKPRFSIKTPEPQIKQKKTDLVKKTAVATPAVAITMTSTDLLLVGRAGQ